MVYANRATDEGDYFLSVGRYAGESIEVFPVINKIVRLIAKYDARAIYRQFGHKKYKDERDFFRKVEKGYIRDLIRPYIEKQVAQVIDELTETGFPLFLKVNRLDNFYKNQQLELHKQPLSPLLKFERTEEYTRYVLRLREGTRVFSPADYVLKILTCQPCRILAGRQVFRLKDDFDGQRLMPFLQKREILIPKANEELYFRKFILKNIRYEEIEVQGFEVIVREVEKKVVLSLEREISAMPVLSLAFFYGTQRIPAWSERKVLVELRTEGATYAFYKVNRDFDWERQQAEKLVEMGLQEHAPGCFYVEGWKKIQDKLEKNLINDGPAKEDLLSGIWQYTVGWILQNRDQLEALGIGFTQKSLRQEYYIGGWLLKYRLQESIDWFELKAEVVLSDGRCIPLIRLREHILNHRHEYMLEDGTVFLIPEEWFAEYTDVLLFGEGKGNALFLHRSQQTLLQKSFGWRELPDSGHVAVTVPRNLRAVLRPYQQIGYEWMYHLFRRRLGGCLADDMGLGKTLQTIALMLKYRQETVKVPVSVEIKKKSGEQLTLFDIREESEEISNKEVIDNQAVYRSCLIVVPASLIHNWRNELRKFAPCLSVVVYAGHDRTDLRQYLQQSDVVIVTYHTLRNDIGYLSRLSFGIVIADEAQMLKNPDSQLHQAMLKIQGECFFALSGTPIENTLTDLWAIMNFVNRGMLGSQYFFRKHFTKPILLDIEGRMKAALQKLITPYILRRTKEEVLAELPELTSELVICEPVDEQRKIYEEEQAKVRNYLLVKQEKQEVVRNDFMVLKALIRLRQIANHPRLVESAYQEDSGKFREIFRMLGEVIGAGHKVLVFSSFVKYLMMVAEEVRKQGWEYALLTGGTTEREQEIRRFSSDPGCRIFLISLKAGGVGLNLTQADYVFLLDPWWNLAAERQAVSRAHRMGQKQAVFVYRFITAGTLEEKILTIQQRKQQLAEAVITSAPLPLTDEELLEALG